MYTRVVVVQVKPDKMDEVLSIWRDSVLPVVKQLQGFKNALLLTNRETGKGISLTLWETEADMKAVESSGVFQQMLAKFTPLFAGQPVLEHYEVNLQA
ncbi:antibiotic biosynthesis monooxygenase [candidate division KSB1 bacterium]|nr:antibiotic biosynthesis monooxygenase [candidate division KSB1 bacterium]